MSRLRKLRERPFALRRSGGGLSVQVPGSWATVHGLRVGSEVTAYADGDRLIFTPVKETVAPEPERV